MHTQSTVLTGTLNPFTGYLVVCCNNLGHLVFEKHARFIKIINLCRFVHYTGLFKCLLQESKLVLKYHVGSHLSTNLGERITLTKGQARPSLLKMTPPSIGNATIHFDSFLLGNGFHNLQHVSPCLPISHL